MNTDNLAMVMTTYLELKAGRYWLAVDSDDGFTVSVPHVPLLVGDGNGFLFRNPAATLLGEFNGGRASIASILELDVPQDGLYPFRITWNEGEGGAGLEIWTSRIENGIPGPLFLLNGPDPGSVKCFLPESSPCLSDEPIGDITLPIGLRRESGSFAVRGFAGRMHQQTNANFENSTLRAERQLVGLLGPSQSSEGFVESSTINYNNQGNSNGAFDVGRFSGDRNFPNVTSFSAENIAVELLAFLELKAGRYATGVGSDDGFVLSIGFDPLIRHLQGSADDIPLSVENPNPRVIARFEGGRGFDENTQEFIVTQDGLYPFRLLFEQGGGPCNLEWWIAPVVNGVRGQPLLVNGVEPDAIPAFVPELVEADTSPRLASNLGVSVADWVQVGRFVAGLDSPALGGEFQKADCAPRVTSGDGRLTISDWVQAGRYAAGLDPMESLSGPRVPATPDEVRRSSFSPAVSIGTSEVRQISILQPRPVDGLICYPVEMHAVQDESGVGFTLVFDPSVARFTGFQLDFQSKDATWLINESQISQGRIGVLLALNDGQTFTPGLVKLGTLKLRSVLPYPDAQVELEALDERAAIGFSNYPVRSEVASNLGSPLRCEWNSRSSSAVHPAAGHLSVVVAGGSGAGSGLKLQLTGLPNTVYEIQISEDLLNWHTVNTIRLTNGVAVWNDSNPMKKGACFFRALNRQPIAR